MPLSLIFSDDVVDSRPYTDVITVMTLSTHVLTLMLLSYQFIIIFLDL